MSKICLSTLLGTILVLSTLTAVGSSLADSLRAFSANMSGLVLEQWGGNDACSWKGISCQSGFYMLQMNQLGLSGNPSLSDLPATTVYIDLSGNQLSGTVDLSSLPTNLQYLSLARNLFTGTLRLDALPALVGSFQIGENEFSGSLNLTTPVSLRSFNGSYNRLTGPVDLSRLPQTMMQVYLNNNLLDGTLALHNLPGSLHTVILSNNKLTGTVAGLQGDLPMGEGLVALDLAGNEICGTLKSTALPRALDALFLSSTNISGNVDFAGLPRLRLLDLSRTKTQGSLAAELLPRSLMALGLQATQHSGTILWGTLPTGMVTLAVAFNEFSGTVVLAALPQTLSILNLEENQFEGSLSLAALPASIKQLLVAANWFFGVLDLSEIRPGLTVVDVRLNRLQWLRAPPEDSPGRILYLGHNPWVCPLPVNITCIDRSDLSCLTTTDTLTRTLTPLPSRTPTGTPPLTPGPTRTTRSLTHTEAPTGSGTPTHSPTQKRTTTPTLSTTATLAASRTRTGTSKQTRVPEPADWRLPAVGIVAATAVLLAAYLMCSRIKQRHQQGQSVADPTPLLPFSAFTNGNGASAPTPIAAVNCVEWHLEDAKAALVACAASNQKAAAKTQQAVSIILGDSLSGATRWLVSTLVLGRGGSGTVRLGANSASGEMVAIKSINLHLGCNASEWDAVRREVALLTPLKHKNIVRYLGSSNQVDCFHLILEYVLGKSLHLLIAQLGRLQPHTAARYSWHITAGLEYLHSGGVLHRDVKPRNVLVTPEGVAKIADFGLHMSALRCAAQFQGSVLYTAPEVALEGKSSTSADVWALGWTVLEMLTGQPPWSDTPAVGASFTVLAFMMSNDPRIPSETEGVPSVAGAFASACLQRDPQLRPAATALLNHAFLFLGKGTF
eukprot:TRINITY_DN93000_c0_g1_i1.p1 TRINITY_DN93000_c0_g1~~TRINITY_DN93000_c0_g1_i1.p1  ORF type:complete len:897 (+),score=91.15 TRINITY_DN93000_c0_g1_i1:51-2741(+)